MTYTVTPYKHTMQGRIDSNSRQRCVADGCPHYRYKISSHCHKHMQKRNLYGHPAGFALHPAKFNGERAECAAFLKHQAAHLGVRAATEWADGWLLGSQAGDQSQLAQVQLSRLADAGVKGLDLVTEACAVWLFSARNTWTLPDDLRLDYAIGRSVLRLAPLGRIDVWRLGRGTVRVSKRITGGTVGEVGQHIRQSIGTLAFRVAYEINKRTLKGEDARALMREPFGPTTGST